MNTKDILSYAKQAIQDELSGLSQLANQLTDDFAKACDLMHNCQGHVVLCGVGKSAHIAGKIAASLSSTGTPAYLLNANEALHGDVGVITKNDVLILVSYSGESSELLAVLPALQSFQVPMIAMTGNPESQLAKACELHLNIHVESEICPNNLAPTTSSTATLILGDALTVTLMKLRDFKSHEFARFHPGGALGRRLTLRARDLMHGGNACPMVKLDCNLADTLLEMSGKRLGMTTVVDADKKLLGIYTDGDLRRTIEKQYDIHDTPIAEVMTKGGYNITADMLAYDVLQFMRDKKITSLVVVDDKNHVEGIVHIHDILQAGL